MTPSAPPPRERPIAVFDSGVGGLTVLQELLVELPHEDFLYLGDTARFPYGERSAAELERFALDIAEVLLARRAKLLVVACNAASSAALDPLRERMLSTTLGVEVLGVIEPESQLAAARSVNRRIGLLATTATVASGAYDRAVHAHAPDATLTSVACPDLAPIIQRGFPIDRRVGEAVRTYCQPLREAGVDTVILGCTHYPLVAPMLQRMLGRGVTLISSGRSLAQSVAATLERAALSSEQTGEGTYRFLCSGDVEAFRQLGSRFLQLPIEEVEHVGAHRGGGGLSSARSYGRAADQCRPTAIEVDFVKPATGSALIAVGETKVICTASIQGGVPRWLAGKGRGWLTAEYGMLPASTGERKQRDISRGRQDGRSVEIQRLIGRSLRAVIDFDALGEHTVYIDCDVLQADGGTRCASITGSYVALARAAARVVAAGDLARSPLTGAIAAVSCGVVGGVPLLDLDYSEDSMAEVDANVVMTADGRLIEVQATAERTPLSRAHLDELLALAARGIDELQGAQQAAIER